MYTHQENETLQCCYLHNMSIILVSQAKYGRLHVYAYMCQASEYSSIHGFCFVVMYALYVHVCVLTAVHSLTLSQSREH